MPNGREPTMRLNEIADLLAKALERADAGNEYMLGAKLSDALICAQERLEAVAREQE